MQVVELNTAAAKADDEAVYVRIPASVTLQGQTVEVGSWTSTGFILDNGGVAGAPDDSTPVTFNVEQKGRELSVRTGARFVKADKKGAAHYAFVGLNPPDRVALETLISDYLAGRIEVVGGEKAKAATEQKDSVSPLRVIGLIALWALLLSVVAIIGASVYQRFFVLNAYGVVRPSSTIAIAAPVDGVVRQTAEEGSSVRVGAPFLIIEPPRSKPVQVNATCDCMVVDSEVPVGAFVRAGRVLATLTETNAPPSIDVLVPISDVSRVNAGAAATAQVVGTKTVVAGVVEQVSVPQVREGMRIDEANAVVRVRLKSTLPLNEIGSPVRVRLLVTPLGNGGL